MEIIYCLKCKTKTETKDVSQSYSKNNKPMLKGKCVLCGSNKSAFSSYKEGGSLSEKNNK